MHKQQQQGLQSLEAINQNYVPLKAIRGVFSVLQEATALHKVGRYAEVGGLWLRLIQSRSP